MEHPADLPAGEKVVTEGAKGKGCLSLLLKMKKTGSS